MLPTQPVEPQSAEAVKPKRKWGWLKVTITLVLLAVVGFVCTVLILFLGDMMGVNGNSDPITVTVEPNTGLNEVSETLHEAGSSTTRICLSSTSGLWPTTTSPSSSGSLTCPPTWDMTRSPGAQHL